LRWDDDRGQITPWTLFGVVVVIVLASLVYDVGMTMADQVRLYDRAQAAARAGAAAIDLDTYRATGTVQLAPDTAVQAAQRFLARTGTSGTVTATAQQVTVTVTTTHPTLLVSIIGVARIPISATATATAVTGINQPI
jgi:hypothetical protein